MADDKPRRILIVGDVSPERKAHLTALALGYAAELVFRSADEAPAEADVTVFLDEFDDLFGDRLLEVPIRAEMVDAFLATPIIACVRDHPERPWTHSNRKQFKRSQRRRR